MRDAPPNTYLPKQIRGAELDYDFWRNRLRLLEHILRKFDPNQPRVPAGNSDGGQWTDGGAGSGASGGLQARPVDFTTVKPPGSAAQGPSIKPIPAPKPGVPFGRGAGPLAGTGALHQLLESDPLNSSFKGTADEATDRYNWLLQNAPENVVPALHFTPHEFVAGQGPKLETTVVPLLREQVESACPLSGAVQTQANLAAQDAGKKSDYRSATEYGTQVHTNMKNIIRNYAESLIPEQSYLKYAEELEGDKRYHKDGVRYGLKDSLRLDVLEKVGNGVICVYDLKTGKSGLSPARMREIGQSVHKNFGMVNRILIIPIQPWLSY